MPVRRPAMPVVLMFLVNFAIFFSGCGLSHEEIRERDEYLYRAQLYYRAQKYYNALQQIEQALRLDPTHKRAMISKGWTLFFLGQLDESQTIFEKILEKDNFDPWCNYGLGSVAFKKAGLTEAKLVETNNQLAQFKDKPAADSQRKKEAALKELEDNKVRFDKELALWYAKSLDYFQLALRGAPDNYDLYKMVAAVYAAQGIQQYPQAITYLDKFIEATDKDCNGLNLNVESKEKERLKPGIPPKEQEQLDLVIDTLREQRDSNRKEYRIAQGMAGDFEFQMAYQASLKAQESVNLEEKARYDRQMREYAQSARHRVELILKTAPDLANQYRNLSNIAKLEGNLDLAAKYLQEYIQHHPLSNPQDRADAKIELEQLEQTLKSQKE